MTPKEEQFWFELLERVSKEIYRLGYEDAKAGKPLKTEGFEVGRANRLTIKNNLKKLTQRR